MKPFQYGRAAQAGEAVATVAREKEAVFLGGGTTLLDLMKLQVLTPSRLVDVNPLPLATISVGKEGLKIGATATMAQVAAHADVAREYPVITEALLASASPQLRNMATIGGNLLQRTRCSYYRDVAWPCNKRIPGSGCPAKDGENRMHAILGVSDHCIATHPSDLTVALVALDAIVHVSGPEGERKIPVREFHLLPGDTPHLETILKPGELILHVEAPANPVAAKSYYLKVRDRASYEFALVSVAAAMTVKDGKITDSRVALGGVGTKPWRSPEAEAVLLGQPAESKSYVAAAAAALKGAKASEHNAFKIEMARRAIVLALTTVGEKP